MKKPFLKAVVLAISGMVLLQILGARQDVAAGVTGTNIQQVEPGMPLEQVLSMLGTPYDLETFQPIHVNGCRNPRSSTLNNLSATMHIRSTVDSIYGDTNYCCSANQRVIQNKLLTLAYTRRVRFSNHYPMLWIHLDSNYQVSSVYAKIHNGFIWTDDPCIYSYSWVTDSTFQVRHDRTEKYVDEKIFNACFN